MAQRLELSDLVCYIMTHILKKKCFIGLCLEKKCMTVFVLLMRNQACKLLSLCIVYISSGLNMEEQ